MIVLDTHALPWMDRDNPALGPAARRLISGAWRAGQAAMSAISAWESAMLAKRGRIVPPRPVTARRSGLIQAGLRKIALDGRIGTSPPNWKTSTVTPPTDLSWQLRCNRLQR